MSRFAALAVACALGSASFARSEQNFTSASEQNFTSASVNSQMLLRDVPFLYTHDAATGYMGIKDYRDVAFQTQSINPISQLDCGVRALDIRLVIDGNNVKYHHGSDYRYKVIPAWWESGQTLDGTLPDFMQWSRDHPSELVLFVISHCYRKSTSGNWPSVNCNDDMIKGALQKYNVPMLIDDCNVASMTLGDVEKKASMPKGGKLLAILGEAGPTVSDRSCFSKTWRSSVTRRDLVMPYMNAIMNQEKNKKNMFAVQAFIQQDSVKVPKSSALNLDVLRWVPNALRNRVNLLEVNVVCSYGTDIAQLFGATVSKSDRNKCMQACGVNWASLEPPAPSPGTCAAKRINDKLISACTTLWNKCGDGWRPRVSESVGIGSCSKCECVPARIPHSSPA